MFPTFISILDIQSWWEVPCIAHFCSLFRTAFNLLDFDIEDLEEALLTDGTEETSWLQELIARLISGCLPNNEISTFNYQMFLRRLFRQKCQEHDRYNPFNTDCDFTLLPLRTKVDILYSLCDFRLDAEDVLEQLKNLEADSLRVEPLGHDSNESAYWYFYGTRLYREDFQKKNNKKKSIWQVICFTEADWLQLTKKFKDSTSRPERALYYTLSKNFLPELPRLFKEKERQARKRLLDSQPKRTSDRLRTTEAIEGGKILEQSGEKKEHEEINNIIRDKEQTLKSEEISVKNGSVIDKCEEHNYEMGSKKRGKNRQRKKSSDSTDAIKELTKKKKSKDSDKSPNRNLEQKMTPIGRQTNNSLSAADGQIVIQSSSITTSNKKKLKTSQVFQQTDEDLDVGMHKILDYVKNHEDAWPFEDPVKEDYAPNYFAIIRRPMDLKEIEKKLDQGYYKTFETFKSDFQLMVNNCRLYNGVENEYTKMADNISKAFEKATEKYLDQIFSSDEEIAVENLDLESDNNDTKGQIKHSNKKRKHTESSPHQSSSSSSRISTKGGKKQVAVVQGLKRKEQSPIDSSSSSHYTSNENYEEKQRKKLKSKNKEFKQEIVIPKESKKVTKEHKSRDRELEQSKKIVTEKKSAKLEKMQKSKKNKSKTSKPEIKNKLKEEKLKKKSHKKKKILTRNRTETSRSPTRSIDTPPPSSPDDYHRLDSIKTKSQGKNRPIEDSSDDDQPLKKPVYSSSMEKYPYAVKTRPTTARGSDQNLSYIQFPFSSPAKDKHNKLRETIEKLKANSEISRMETTDYFDVSDHHKENKEKNHKRDKNGKIKHKSTKLKKNREEINGHGTTRMDGTNKLVKKKEYPVKFPDFIPPFYNRPKQSNFDALSLATEQTLKDIDKWLDDTPKFDDYSSASNSPAYNIAMDEFDLLAASNTSTITTTTTTDSNNTVVNTAAAVTIPAATCTTTTTTTAASANASISSIPKIESKKVDKIVSAILSTTATKKEGSNTTTVSSNTNTSTTSTTTVTSTKESKKKIGFKDPSKFFKRREIQRTIDRLQPGKSKGNLISNVQNSSKNDDTMFPLGPLSKIKDPKNSLIVKTDTNAPKLSLGSVLDNFGKHKFVDDTKKDDDEENQKDNDGKEKTEKKIDNNVADNKEPTTENSAPISKKEENGTKSTDDPNNGDPTPNLSAWFKAFGAPKAPPQQTKKIETKPPAPPIETRDENESAKSERVPVPDPSPNLDSPQPLTRQRRMSTGSSMSERSSFSQDLDSPRVGMDERGAYPAPYPSPLHRSPSGASPIMASPRPDISPRSAYHFNGQMRVGFYQDTVSNKSSPDKSCSPRDNPQSPYYNASEHVYASNGTQNNIYSYGNSPYTHQANYSTTNPTPPYNTDMSSAAYYDTSKSLAEQYQTKSMQNYTANSPAGSQPSPSGTQPQLSPHSPIIHPQMSPSMHSQHSPSVHSPSMHSPNVHPSQHSPNINSPQLQSPNRTGLHSPGMNGTHSPQMSMHSPQMNVHSPQMNVHSPQMSVHSPQMSVHSPQVNSPIQHSPGMHAAAAVVGVPVNSPHHHSQVNSPLNCGGVETFHPQQDDNSNSNTSGMPIGVDNKMQANVISQVPTTMFPVKKRAFVENELAQFGPIPNDLLNRNMHMTHQLPLSSSQSNSEMEVKQMDCQGILQHQQQQQQSQLLQQQMHLQQQKQSLLRQAQQNQQQQSQHQLLHQQNQQQMQQQQHHHHQQQQHTPLYGNQNDSSMSNPSSPMQQQSQQIQQQQQQMPAHSSATYTGPTSQQAQPPYGRDSYPLNIPSANRLMQHQQKLDMSKFTNMGYTGPDVNYSRALQQQYGRPDLNYTRPPVPQSSSAQLLNSQVVGVPKSVVANHPNRLSGNQQAHNAYQSNRSVESVAERLAAQNQPEVGGAYKTELERNNFNSTLDVNLGRNLSNIVDRYNEQRMMVGLPTSDNPYYTTDKGMGNPHVFNKAMPSASQIFSQTNATNISTYNPTMAVSQTANLYNRQMTDLQNQAQAQTQNEVKATAPTVPEKKPRKKKSKAPVVTSDSQHTVTPSSSHVTSAASSQGFQSYVGLKGPPNATAAVVVTAAPPPPQSAPPSTTSISGTTMEPSAISLKTNVVPGSAFNFGPAAPGGPIGPLGSSLYGDKDAYSNFLEDFRTAPNFYMAAAAAHHRSTTPAENPVVAVTKNNQSASTATQSYPSFLNPAHQSRPPAYPLGSPFIPPAAQAPLMDTSSPLYQHYLQAGVLNQGLLGPAGAYPPGYHAALAMRQPYDPITRPSWL